MTLTTILPWVLSIVSIFMLYMMGNKSKWGPRIGVAAQVLWIIFVVSTEQWGLLPGVLGWTLVQVRNLVKWEGWSLPVRGYDEYGNRKGFFDWRKAESVCLHQVFIQIRFHEDCQLGRTTTCRCQLCDEEFVMYEEQEHIIKFDEDTWLRGKKESCPHQIFVPFQRHHDSQSGWSVGCRCTKCGEEFTIFLEEDRIEPFGDEGTYVRSFDISGIDLDHHGKDDYGYGTDSPYNTGGTEQDQ